MEICMVGLSAEAVEDALIHLENGIVEELEAAMARFKAGLRKLVQIPKAEIAEKPKRKVTKKRP